MSIQIEGGPVIERGPKSKRHIASTIITGHNGKKLWVSTVRDPWFPGRFETKVFTYPTDYDEDHRQAELDEISPLMQKLSHSTKNLGEARWNHHSAVAVSSVLLRTCA